MPTLADISEVAICNLALAELGRGAEITSLDENSQPARACRRRYPHARDAILRSYDWNFAARRASLPASAARPAFGYDNAFDLPPDCLLVRAIHDACTPWEVEGTRLLASTPPPLRITYTARVTNPGVFDSLFVDVLATRLAADLCVQLTENTPRAQALLQLVQLKLDEARHADAREGNSDRRQRSSWLDARFEPGFVLQPEEG
jgi:hypothetical protein